MRKLFGDFGRKSFSNRQSKILRMFWKLRETRFLPKRAIFKISSIQLKTISSRNFFDE